MNRQRSFKEYRTIDLCLLAGLLIIFEFIIIKVSRSILFRDQPFTVSLAASITTLAYMRWGYRGGIHAVLAGFVYCLFGGGAPFHYAIYMAGNLLSLLAVVLLEKLGYEKVRTDRFLKLAFPLLVIFLMHTGRAAVAVLIGASPAAAFGFFTTDVLSDLFTLVIIWIASRTDGLYENQRHYLIRIHEEEKEP